MIDSIVFIAEALVVFIFCILFASKDCLSGRFETMLAITLIVCMAIVLAWLVLSRLDYWLIHCFLLVAYDNFAQISALFM